MPILTSIFMLISIVLKSILFILTSTYSIEYHTVFVKYRDIINKYHNDFTCIILISYVDFDMYCIDIHYP